MIQTRLAIHLTLIFSKLKILLPVVLHKIHVSKKTNKRDLLSSLSKDALTQLKKLKQMSNEESFSNSNNDTIMVEAVQVNLTQPIKYQVKALQVI